MGMKLVTLRQFVSPTLTCLRLTHCDLLLVEDLLPMLKQVTGLEELTLERTIRISDSTLRVLEFTFMLPGPPDRVSLSQLRKLMVGNDYADEVFYLIDRLSFPPTTSMTLQFLCLARNAPNPSNDLAAAILSKIVSYTGRLPAIRTFSLFTDIGAGCSFSLWDDRLSTDCFPRQMFTRDGACFSFWLCSAHTSSSFIARLLHLLPLSQVQCAILTERAVGSVTIPWEPLISYLPSLEDLILEYETFDRLTPHSEPYQIRPVDTRTLCLSLETLRMRESHYESSAVQDIPADLVHLGCIARGLVSCTEDPPAASQFKQLEVIQSVDHSYWAHGSRCVSRMPLLVEREYNDSPSSPRVNVSRNYRFKARIIDYASRISGLFKQY